MVSFTVLPLLMPSVVYPGVVTGPEGVAARSKVKLAEGVFVVVSVKLSLFPSQTAWASVVLLITGIGLTVRVTVVLVPLHPALTGLTTY